MDIQVWGTFLRYSKAKEIYLGGYLWECDGYVLD